MTKSGLIQVKAWDGGGRLKTWQGNRVRGLCYTSRVSGGGRLKNGFGF